MRKWICALLVAALLAVGCAWATEATEAPATTAEIIAIEAVQIGNTPAPTEAVDPDASADAQAASPAPTEAPKYVSLGFADGFSLDFPEGWLYYPTDEEMANQGVLYCLSDASRAAWLYIQRWDTDCADIDALKELIDRTTTPQTSGVYDFNGTEFVVYDLTDDDVSCCAALLDGQVLNFVFTPQSDADFMAVAAQMMSTFAILEI